PKQVREPETSLANLTVAMETAEVAVDGAAIEVPRRELAVLRQLMRRAGRVVSREHLENSMYDDSREIESNALEAAVSRLRKRLAGAGATVEIQGLRGAGYLIRARPA
ncbi:MAG TPA: winged helix-turn-helix domain-containing protein, partial [Candidatus Bathyarchaeia archaeon]|nr:winged helix-turn-helix domain-containing protein [Candidatus Bathyarchaeia archaeon]